MVLRASPFVSFLVGFLVVAGAARASVSLKVRAVPVPAARGKAASVSAGRPRSPDLARAQAERERRWRGFPDHYGPRGFDWSRGAGRPRAARERDARARAEAGADVAYHARVAFIRIDFLHDRGGDKSSGDGHFDLSPRDTTRPAIDRPPHHRDFYLAHLEALSRYYLAQSFGRTQIEGDVWPQERDSSYHLPDMADLGPWEFSTDIYPVAVRMFRQMLFAADSQSTAKNDRIPWGDYDRIVLIHAGSDLQSDVRQDSPEDIPSFTIGVADTDTVIFPDDSLAHAFLVDRGTIVPETINQDGLYGAINTVLCLLIFLKLGWVSAVSIFGTYFFMSIMFPTIFALGIFGLGQRAKKASSFLVMAIMGGAILPKLMGHVADQYDMSRGFIVPAVCFAFVAFYGLNWPRFSKSESFAWYIADPSF